MPVHDVVSEDALNKAFNDNKSVVLIFGAAWSSVCVATRKTFEDISGRYSSVYFGWVDIDNTPDLREKYGITDIPTTFGYKSKEQVIKYIGPILQGSQAENIIKKTL
ncbi:thioredoxin-like protein [Macrophomina phaseolina]|uniref:Thioredoxin-like protein n=1 Tax=Macrophomina phaseolina TaxID=35725 RepID=A0ABQ8FS17_9PEZI|nr:thioredoxin-like protein [Macrophomina phaseolina]